MSFLNSKRNRSKCKKCEKCVVSLRKKGTDNSFLVELHKIYVTKKFENKLWMGHFFFLHHKNLVLV